MQLQALQNTFQQYLTESVVEPLLPEITNDDRLDVNTRLGIYFDAYRLRLRDICKDDFDKTATLLGDAQFDAALYGYLKANPSTHFSVRYFAKDFPRYLAETAPWSEHPVLSEMATFEWLVSHTLDAADGEILTQESLSTLAPDAWPNLKLTLHPSVISHVYIYDTPQLWQDIDTEKPPRQPEKQEQGVRWIYNRKGIKSLYRSCNVVENMIFEAILADKCFSEICEILMEQIEESENIPMIVAQTLFTWVEDEFFVISDQK